MNSRARGVVVATFASILVLAAMAFVPSASGRVTPLPTLATGHVQFAAGVSSGQVLAFADPNQTTAAKGQAGALLPTPLIASADVASDGSFTLQTDPSKLPTSTEASDGTVNVEAVVVSGGQELSYFFPATPVTTADGVVFASTSTVGAKTPDLQFDMSTGSALNARYSPTKWLNSNGHTSDAFAAKTSRASALGAATPALQKMAASAGTVTATTDEVGLCGLLTLTPDDNGRHEHFVNVYDDGSTDTHIAEGGGSTHTLGIAVQLIGGGWTGSGTANISRSSDTKVTSKDRQHSWGYWNKVNYRPYRDTCTHRDIEKAIGFYDLISADIDGSVQYDFYTASCGQKAKGDQWDTTDATAATFGGGVGVAGINVSAQAGYRTSVNIHMKFLEGGSVRGTSSSGPLNSSKVDSSTFPC